MEEARGGKEAGWMAAQPWAAVRIYSKADRSPEPGLRVSIAAAPRIRAEQPASMAHPARKWSVSPSAVGGGKLHR